MSSRARAVIAAAGSCKTQLIVERALELVGRRVLVATFTLENQKQITRRLEAETGVVPQHVEVLGWFTFLLTHGVRPFQSVVTGAPFVVRGLNFLGERNRYTPRTSLSYYLDGNADVYRNGAADLVIELNRRTNGLVVDRLERIFQAILIDEVQDLVGYDLDILDLLLRSRLEVLVVGDPRQFTLQTNTGPRNRKYRGVGLFRWLGERKSICEVELRNVSARCNQAICDFADSIYPRLPPTLSSNLETTGHDGVFCVSEKHLVEYKRQFQPVILRNDKNVDTLGLRAMNIGVAKGSTFDRVVVVPTGPMLKFIRDRDPDALKAPERLYVAVTRARFSVAIVVPDALASGSVLPLPHWEPDQ